jgi:hypothetical protein
MMSRKPAGLLKALLMCGLVVTVGANALAQTYVFNTAVLATGNNPQAVVNADINGDGKLDLIVANFNDNTVSVLMGNTDGSFQPRVDYATGANPTALVVADFNNDAKNDIAVVNNNCPTAPCVAVGSVSVLLGNGDGTFQAHIDTNVGNSPNALATADFNKDGKQDLVISNGQDNTISVLLGKANGSFSTRQVATTGTAPHGVAIADFTDDGLLDVVVANSGESDMTLFRGKGDGTFASPLVFTTGPNPVAIIAADFSGDGKADVALANSGSSTVTIMIRQQPRGFLTHTELTVAGLANSLVAADFTGDGKLDLAVGTPGPGAFSVLPGNGDGTFQAHQEFAVGSDPVSLTVGDFTADGKLDVVAANDIDNTLYVLPGDGKGAFQSRLAITVGTMPGSVATADFNGDLLTDIAVANRSDNTLLVLLNNGDGTFTPAPGSRPQTGRRPSAVIAVDVNGDGYLDLVTTNALDNTISILLGNGDGTFQAATSATVGKNPVALAAGDFNKDGKQDLAVVNQNDPSVSVLLGNGNGTFQLIKSYFTGTGSNPSAIAIDDFIGAGKLALAVANGGNGTVGVLLGFGDGTFTTAVNYTTSPGSSGVATADFNADGHKDLAVSNSTSNNVSILLGVGNGTFQTHVDFPTAKFPYSVVGADFNGDGKTDLALGTSGPTSNRISVLLGNGDGTFQPHVDHGTKVLSQGSGEALAVADFNNDGTPDMVATDQIANIISVFTNTALLVPFPAKLEFGLEDIGVPSPAQTVTLVNNGSAPANNLAVSTTNTDYTATSNCGSSLAVGANCSTDVTFTPSRGGSIPASLVFNDTGLGGFQSVALDGQGNAAAVQLSATNLTFGVVLVGQTSGKQDVTLTNTGSQTLTITSIKRSGDFKLSSTCGTTVAPGAQCTISVVFAPKDSGTRQGSVVITDNALDSPQTITLTGTGTVVKLAPSGLAFGNQRVGTSSNPQTVTMTNVGTRVLNVSDISTIGTNAGDFSISNNTCIPTVQPSASCTFSVTFTPSQLGTRSASVSITDDGGGSPQLVPLSGTGI